MQIKPNNITRLDLSHYNSTIRWEKPSIASHNTSKVSVYYFTSPSYTASSTIVKQSVNPGYLLDRYV